MGTLSEGEIEGFVANGYHRLPAAFPRELAAACVDALWTLTGVERGAPSTWIEPVIRVAGSTDPAVVAAINTERLTSAIDDLVGPGAWKPRRLGFGTFPVRFPSDVDPGDCGWHIDGSFGNPPAYRVNFRSKGRALLLLMLFTDVRPDDAPTRIKAGSPADVARALRALDPEGVTFDPWTMAPAALERDTHHAIGDAGDVYLCHPFLVHAATWPHRGRHARFVGQPCIHHPQGEWLGEFDYDDTTTDSPVKRAVREALHSRT